MTQPPPTPNDIPEPTEADLQLNLLSAYRVLPLCDGIETLEWTVNTLAGVTRRAAHAERKVSALTAENARLGEKLDDLTCDPQTWRDDMATFPAEHPKIWRSREDYMSAASRHWPKAQRLYYRALRVITEQRKELTRLRAALESLGSVDGSVETDEYWMEPRA